LKARFALFLLATAMPCANIAAAAPPEYSISIAEGPLSAALEAYGQATGRQLLYRSDVVQGLTARALRGTFTADEALRRLLDGTGIKIHQTRSGAFVLSRGSSGRPPAARALQAAVASKPQRARRPVPGGPSIDEAPIVVTGSNLRRPGRSAAEVITLSRADIERSGAGSLAEAVGSLPQNFSGTATEDTSLTSADSRSLNIGLGSSVNLRGLGSNATLTLVNGRRVAGSGGKGDFADLSLIPLLLVERVEVLPDGASAIYGSDAVGGVVNVVLRRRFDGAETRLRVGTSTRGGGEDVQAGQLLGASWGSGHVLAAYDFERRDRLAAWQRRFTRSADLRPFGGNDWRLYFSNPASVLVSDPKTRSLVPAFGVPAGQDGRNLQPQDFTAGANLQNHLLGTDILPRQQHHIAYAFAEQALGPRVKAFAEGRFAQRRYDFNGPAAVGAFQVTPSNPFFASPTGSSSAIVAYSFYGELGPSRNVGKVRAWSGTFGLEAEGPKGWLTQVYASRAEERTRTRSDNLVNSTFANEALGTAPDNPQTPFSASRDGFLNLFGAGRVNSRPVLDFIAQAYSEDGTRSRVTAANVQSDGPLFSLPGGSARAAVGATFRREAFLRAGESFFTGTTPTPLSRTDADRSIKAVFAEVLLPLLGGATGIPAFRRLELTAAVRHERYSDFGATTDPKVTLLWEPVAGLSLFGSYGTSFRAPALRESRDRIGVSATQLPNGRGGQTPVLFLTGGNPDLTPERARSLSGTLKWAPPASPGTTLQATLFATRFRGRIEQPALEDSSKVLADPIYAPFVRPVNAGTNAADRALVLDLMTRPGSQVPTVFPPEFFQAIVDGRYVNAAEVRVKGIDVLATRSFPLAGGTLATAFNASYLMDYKRRITPVAPAIERVATLGNPTDLRARATASWTKKEFGLSVGLNYVNGYTDLVSVPSRRVAALTTADFQIRYDGAASGPWKNVSAAFSVQNAFDRDPPFANRRSGHGYDATNADPIGRYIALQLTTRW
jgi:iron complex outermembrane receptor protein